MADVGVSFQRSPGSGRTTTSFGAQLEAFAAEARGKVGEVAKGVARRAATDLAGETHVITGRLVGNWRVSLNVEDFFYDESKLDPGRSQALAENLQTISLAQAGDRIFLTNNTPYLVYEEFGTSRRAGHPVVRTVLARVPQYVSEAVAEVRSAQAPGFGQRVRAFFGG